MAEIKNKLMDFFLNETKIVILIWEKNKTDAW